MYLQQGMLGMMILQLQIDEDREQRLSLTRKRAKGNEKHTSLRRHCHGLLLIRTNQVWGALRIN